LGLPDAHPDQLVRDTDPAPAPDPSIMKQKYDFLSLKKDVNVPSKIT
jgi:hypothetical protein